MRVKSEERRRAIIEVARQVFTELGFETTSMSQIAARVGGSKATLYNYFSSKDELFAAVIEEFGRQKIADAFTSLKPEAPLEQELCRFGEHYLGFVLSPEALALRTVVFHEAGRSSVGREYYLRGPLKGWTQIRHYLDKQRQQGRIRCDDSWVAALHLKALLDAELAEPCALGVRPMPDVQEIKQVTARAIRVFLAAYQQA
ncbi:TetR/AcrR family transcriptional regulator [Pseudaeromonas sharmana]|uniref:TetR/AcrR family transcriptional regulator n=1 Tax=Pseudaeromonas sharmana TaxID=328412 RepID=A0ABV8CQ45_9GAMM